MVDLVTLLAGLHHSRFRSLSAVPLTHSALLLPLHTAYKLLLNFGGKSLHALIFKRLFFPIETKRKASYILVTALSGENW